MYDYSHEDPYIIDHLQIQQYIFDIAVLGAGR